MKSTEILNKIKTFLGEEVEETQTEKALELAQLKLENGTVLEAEAFESGNEIFILTEDEKVAVPQGEYLMEDGRTLVVQEEGVIEEIKAGEHEEKEEEKEEEKVDARYVSKEELSETPATEPIAHNPEVVEKFKVKFSQNRRETTLDKIMKKLSNN